MVDVVYPLVWWVVMDVVYPLVWGVGCGGHSVPLVWWVVVDVVYPLVWGVVLDVVYLTMSLALVATNESTKAPTTQTVSLHHIHHVIVT